METIPTIFQRDPEHMRQLLRQPHPDCAWVFAGEGVATRKYDGTACLVTREGILYRRLMVRAGRDYPEAS